MNMVLPYCLDIAVMNIDNLDLLFYLDLFNLDVLDCCLSK